MGRSSGERQRVIYTRRQDSVADRDDEKYVGLIEPCTPYSNSTATKKPFLLDEVTR
jgi:hypothetical protein